MSKDIRRFIFRSLCIFTIFFLTACGTATPQVVTRVVKVYATSAASPWLQNVYKCAPSSVAVSLSYPASADFTIRLGEQTNLSTPAYEIGSENIIVIMNNARPPLLTPQQIEGLFTGEIVNWNQITPEWGKAHITQSGDVHVWVYSADEDIEQILEKSLLDGRPVTSSARIAATSQEMIDAIRKDGSAIGILPQRLNENNEVFNEAVIASVPVLAITKSEPQGAIKQLIACLQKQ